MTLAITDDHRALAETARSLLARQGGTAGAREATEERGEKLPASWDELVGVGWLGLHVAGDVGGQGFGLPELAVVLFELGRVVGPGPFLPSVWAAAVIERCGSDAQRRAYLPDLVTGRRIGAVGLATDLSVAGSIVAGDGGLVLGGGWADVLVLAVGPDLVLLDRHAGGVTIDVTDGLDRTRPLARVRVDDVAIDPSSTIPAAAATALDLGRILAAAEAAGGAEACTDLATAYAKERQQFGRVIGSFQAVKHRLADMLVDAELAAAAAWDAARAGTGDRQQELCATVAALQCMPAYVRNAKASIQVHGGIGFTWEHDAHLYVRRATALAMLFAVPDPAGQAVELARAGVRRETDVELPPEADAFREQVRAFRDEVVGLDAAGQRRRLVESGYLVPHWPAPWGRGAGPVEQLVIDEELEPAVRRPSLGISGWVTLTIAEHGTADQQERWVRPSLAGALEFCQLFSEPEAGSDAAAIRTAGVRVDGGWLVNGQKVWTSGAHLSNRGFATVRTDPSVSKHEGVTMMVIDMKASGVEVRPLRQITGDAHFNEVFFTDVFVADDDVVGGVGQGWKVARATLGNERVSIGGGPAFAAPASALAAGADPRWVSELGPLLAEAQTLKALVMRMVARAVAGAGAGPEGNVTKLVTGEHTQRITDLALRMGGPAAVADEAPMARMEYLAALCLTIAGGSSEIIRSQIGERILGLPREPNLR